MKLFVMEGHLLFDALMFVLKPVMYALLFNHFLAASDVRQ